MSDYVKMIRGLKTPDAIAQLTHLYGHREGAAVYQLDRYTRILKKHEERFHSERELSLVSAPGRTEIGGNHTDHNNGRVLAAAINLDTICAVSPNSDNIARIHSEGYEPFEVDLTELKPVAEEQGRSASIVRGIAARMKELGYMIGGFDAVLSSDVLSGSGLSSSAAFEVLICAVIDSLYNGWEVPAKTRAQIAQYAENKYFGKPCGLMDQMASSVGGLISIDFVEETPKTKSLTYDFAKKGFALVIVNTGSAHDNLTEDYAAIRAEMQSVAAHFGKKVLREVIPEEVIREIRSLREEVGDRAVLRAIHYFDENERVLKQIAALEDDNLHAFLKAVMESGNSSWKLLQNVTCPKNGDQSLAIALTLTKRFLHSTGAYRVHGGGFAGTIQAYIPNDKLADYVAYMENVFGDHCCFVADIRPEGAARIII
ncbi:MAG: galactokinase family protein [Eubacteriales bacterium]|nr:galactokinase family protein [Eubacteriales bacterium]MDD3880886.1 galactokinase family protein [Eubacteriales bacterium]MDD4511747.1 galactokinase family protein [Eubacteriales bacterium]